MEVPTPPDSAAAQGNAARAAPAGVPPNENTRLNLRVARISIAGAVVLGSAKLAAAVVTGSLGIAATLLDSFMDVVASTVNMFAIRYAAQPADEEHAYGHGKIEALAGLTQGLIVSFTGLFVLYEGTRRLLASESAISRTDVGIGVMVLSLVGSVWIGGLLARTARKTGSVALAADSTHYTSDVWLNGGVLGALVVIRLTGWAWVDGAIACGAALFVLRAAYRVLHRAVNELMDIGISEADQARVRAAIARSVPEVRDIHRFRTRRAGPTVFVDMHVSLDRNLSFVEAHRLSERVGQAIQRELGATACEAHVHADPYPFLPEDLP